MNDFLSFKKMITPLIIQFVFGLGVILCVIGGLIAMFQGQFFPGLMFIVVGPLSVRIYCEIVILAFRINETLTEIERNTRGGGR